jgi:hypothetical protein
MPVLLWTDFCREPWQSRDMRRSLWSVVFITVVMLSNPGVDVPLSHMPTLALVFGSLALVVSWLAAAARPTPALSTGRPLGPSATK